MQPWANMQWFVGCSHVVERASQWLCDHHSSRLLNCETAEKKVTQTDQVYGEQLHYLGNTNTAVLVKGLRYLLFFMHIKL